jgi:pimeloyl-ACP methyl ester carboxylesterase
MLAIDRPGYGYSGLGCPDTNVAHQASLIARVLQKFRATRRKIILHGSSYGGTVAARIAMDYPELIDGLLLQSASMAPGAEKIFWLSYPTSHWSLRWLIPATFRVANAEKLSHRSQLEAMAPRWERIAVPTIILHGSEDGLIYPENAYYACDRLSCVPSLEMYMAPGRGHDLLWTTPQIIRAALLRLLQ